MTKRNGNFYDINSKKQKVDYDLEALWGDDLDEDAIDDCIQLAISQVPDEVKTSLTQLNESMLIPSYNIFKQPKAIFSSTQLNSNLPPSTSNKNPNNVCPSSVQVQAEFKKLQEHIKEKEGEVSVLRSQLKEAQSHIHLEQQKTHTEWRRKLNMSQKELTSTKSELEFKNLEIANLKQKFLDISKHKTLNTTLNFTQNVTPWKVKVETIKPPEPTSLSVTNYPRTRKQPILEPRYPLNKLLLTSLILTVSCQQDKYATKTKLNRNTIPSTIPYLKNHVSSNNATNIMANIQLRCTFVDKKKLDLDYLYPELVILINCTQEEINSKESVTHLNKLICVALQFLSDLRDYLKAFKNITSLENIQQTDFLYLKNEFEANHQDISDKETLFDENEFGVKAGQSLNILSEILPHSHYLKNYICAGVPLLFQNTNGFVSSIPCMVNYDRAEPFQFVNTLLEIVSLIGQIRKSHVTSSFLCAVVKLLIKICECKQFANVCDVFCKITKEIIFARPKSKVLYKMTLLLKVASRYSKFVEFLFGGSPNWTKLPTNSQKEFCYFNSDSCRFYIFAAFFYNTIFKRKSEDLPLSVCMNLLSFVCNSYKWSFSIHHQDVESCECLPQLYKLEMEIVFNALKTYQDKLKGQEKISDDWKSFFEHQITLRVLHLLVFNSYELTEKYATVYSQYRELETKLVKDLNNFENLSKSEEIPIIHSSKFENIDF